MMLASVGFREVAVQCGYTDGRELLNGSSNLGLEPTASSVRTVGPSG